MSPLITKWRQFTAGIARHIEVWRTAWREQKRQEPVAVPQGKELEFLPAVLEIQESPPSPVGRTIIFIIVGVFSAALLWSVFGHIDIVAVAQGKIIPSDYSKVIQPLESGIIKKIHVRDGQHVKKDDVLIELDATTTGADRERYSNEYLSALTEVARLQALIADQDIFTSPKGANPRFVEIQRNRYEAECSAHAAALIEGAVRREGIAGSVLVLHQDNGSPMKGSTFIAKLDELGVRPSFSRPGVSDDNAYSESLFRTCKYRPTFPAQGFRDIDHARTHMLQFARWYNHEHKHRNLKFVSPGERHAGEERNIFARRIAVYEQARVKHPGRWSKNIRDWSLPTEVWLNRPTEQSVLREAA